MTENSELNQRHYRLMIEAITDYEAGQLRLGSLVDRLEELGQHLENVPPEWTEAYFRECSLLEIIFAVALDQQRKLNPQERADIAQALIRLRAMIEPRIITVHPDE